MISPKLLCLSLGHCSAIYCPCVPSPIPQFDLAAAPCGGSQESQPRIRKLQGYRVIIRSEDLTSMISELHTSDLKAINHIVARAEIYQKAPSMLIDAEILLGKEKSPGKYGSLCSAARGFIFFRIPLLEVAQIRAVYRDFLLRKRLSFVISGLARRNNKTAQRCVEVLSWLRRMTLDVIGQAAWDLAGICRAARNQMYIIGKQIVSKSKADIKAAEGEKSLRLNDIEIISDHSPFIEEIPTFFLAGHETTSSATAWALYALSVNTAAQTKLREETADHVNRQPNDGRTQLTHFTSSTVIRENDASPCTDPSDGRISQRLSATFLVPEQTSSPFLPVHTTVSGSAFPLMKALLFTLIRAFEFEYRRFPRAELGLFTAGLIQNTTVLGEGKGSGLP
ncbi:hypothetical protein B0H14DRAFT_2609575 [Mycena olivaceomarginata]|nr:hypothetical protein B0H14DRAFT_2609575 [Mycena olivaceomarginata]